MGDHGKDSQIGIVLANRLGLCLNKREGHDLAGPCIACKSSDAFRLHDETGVAQCYSCGGKWSPFQVAESGSAIGSKAKQLLVEIGLFKPDPESNGGARPRSHRVDRAAEGRHRGLAAGVRREGRHADHDSVSVLRS